MTSPTPFDLAARLVPTPPAAVAKAGTHLPPPLSRSNSRSSRAAAGEPTPPTTTLPPSELDVLFPGPHADAAADERSKGAQPKGGLAGDGKMLLELADGSAYEGYAFGADKSITGECVFQTGADTRHYGWKTRS